MLTEEAVSQVMKLLAEQKNKPVTITDPDNPRSTIVLMMNDDGQIVLDLENSPDLFEHQVKDLKLCNLDIGLDRPSSVPVDDVFRILSQKTSAMGKTMVGVNSALAAIYGRPLNAIYDESSPLRLKPRRNYGPCRECGKPTKGGHCFTCRSKAA